jgi:hypothetical protein
VGHNTRWAGVGEAEAASKRCAKRVRRRRKRMPPGKAYPSSVLLNGGVGGASSRRWHRRSCRVGWRRCGSYGGGEDSVCCEMKKVVFRNTSTTLVTTYLVNPRLLLAMERPVRTERASRRWGEGGKGGQCVWLMWAMCGNSDSTLDPNHRKKKTKCRPMMANHNMQT